MITKRSIPDVATPNEATSESGPRPSVSVVERQPANRARILARAVIRDGKTFKQSALEAGYSETTARRSLGALMAESSAVTEAIRKETEAITYNIASLKPLAIQRLHREIVDPESPNGMKAIELAGRFKETDWFVRHSEQNLGVYIAIAESQPNDALEIADKYRE